MAIGPLSVIFSSLKSVRANNSGLSFVKVNDECVGFVLMCRGGWTFSLLAPLITPSNLF